MLVMPKKKGSHVDPVGFPRFALLARVLPSFVNDCVTVQICVFQPERGVDESGELGKDKWRQRLLSAMAAGNPVNFSLSHSRLHLSRALFPPACATVFILHSLVVRSEGFFPFRTVRQHPDLSLYFECSFSVYLKQDIVGKNVFLMHYLGFHNL